MSWSIQTAQFRVSANMDRGRMARPRVLVSSTCEDLYPIREQLRALIDALGYEPVLSEEGDVYYSPDLHVHLSCLREVRNCDIVVLIVGNRFGSESVACPPKSVTQTEHDAAHFESIPVFAFIDQRVLHDYATYRRAVEESTGRSTEEVVAAIPFGSRADYRVFLFIDDLRMKLTNNAYFPYNSFADISDTLKKQWAGMMFDFLRQRSLEEKDRQVVDLLERLEIASSKVEEVVGLIATETLPSKSKTALDAIDSRSTEKRLQSLFQGIWKGVSLAPDANEAVTKVAPGQFTAMYRLLLTDETPKESARAFLRRAQNLGLVRPKSGFLHFSVKYRVDELREWVERKKITPQMGTAAMRDALTTVLQGLVQDAPSE